MSYSTSSIETSLPLLAGSMKAQETMMRLSMAIFKQIQDSQEMQAQALINMINQTPSPDGTGRVVDVSA
ncbi:MAG: putative motility protein [Chloroflexi bacterium]|nr:putative motility protein [Chloroflexota bacterium]